MTIDEFTKHMQSLNDDLTAALLGTREQVVAYKGTRPITATEFFKEPMPTPPRPGDRLQAHIDQTAQEPIDAQFEIIPQDQHIFSLKESTP